MATSTVSASVDVNVKRLAGMYIKRKGLTANEVIRRIWDHIAATGEIPLVDDEGATASGRSAAFAELLDLRASVPSGTPLDTMDAAALRRELMSRHG